MFSSERPQVEVESNLFEASDMWCLSQTGVEGRQRVVKDVRN